MALPPPGQRRSSSSASQSRSSSQRFWSALVKSLSVRANRLFNAALGRGRGRVWDDRYHRRDLTSPRQVRHTIVYCLGNYKKHQNVTSGAPRIDPCSSARWFQGWSMIRTHDDGPRPTA